MEPGNEQEIKKHFTKVFYTVWSGVLWLITNAILGIYFKLAIRNERPLYINLLFYAFLLGSLFFLVRFYLRVWRKKI